VASKNSTSGAADCSPCADSNFTLKEEITKLNDMDLVVENKSNANQTNRIASYVSNE
jgi:hypothetical protein